MLMPSTRSSVLLSFLLTSIVLADAHHPSRDVVLIYPTSSLNVSETAALGYSNNVAAGMDQNVTLSLQYPNGTEALVFGSSREPCGAHPSRVTAESLPLNATGTYTAFWNFTYITSSNGTLDSSGCVVAPFSLQSFLLNASFEVQQLSKGTGEVSINHTTELPAQPTGIVSAAMHASTRMGWYSMVASLVGVNVALGWYA